MQSLKRRLSNWTGNWKVGYGWLKLDKGQTKPGNWREIRLLVVRRGCSSCCSLPVSKQGDICVRYVPLELFEHILHLPSGHFTCSLMSFAKKYIYSYNMTKGLFIWARLTGLARLPGWILPWVHMRNFSAVSEMRKGQRSWVRVLAPHLGNKANIAIHKDFNFRAYPRIGNS